MLSLILAASVATQTPIPAGLSSFLRDRHIARYDHALTDLDGDGRPEVLVYAMASRRDGARYFCGSGGCALYVLSLTPTGYRTISRISVTRPPIRILSSRSHGWRDLGVMVAGGGVIPGYQARLRFDGKRYPTNPSVPPALRLKGSAQGKVVITGTGR